MPALLIKNVPPALHRRLKQVARRQRRSMTQQALAILEYALGQAAAELRPLPPPFKGRFPLTDKILREAKRGRM